MISNQTLLRATTPPLLLSRANRPRRWARPLAISFIWITNLVLVALWVHGNGIEDLFGTTGSLLSSVGRITGLVGSNMLLFQVLLMSRMPLFEQAFGHDMLTRLHRLSGFWSFWLILAHIVFITLGYSVLAAINPFVQIWSFIWTYPGILLATVGTLLIIGVVIVSLARLRHRLRYESWHLLHLYAYLGVGLALPHQIWTGSDFSATPAQLYWWTFWALAAATCLWYRLLVPLYRSHQAQLTVESISADSASSTTVMMRGIHLQRLHAEAGQFFIWRFRAGPGWTRGHPFSLSARPTDSHFQITARHVGDATKALKFLKPGTRVLIEGPYGMLTGAQRSHRKLLFFTAGAGITPAIALLQSELYAPGDAVLITREHDLQNKMLGRQLDDLTQTRGVIHHELLGAHSTGQSSWLSAPYSQWRGDRFITFLVPDLSQFDIYICGPRPWMHSLIRDLQKARARTQDIHFESFAI